MLLEGQTGVTLVKEVPWNKGNSLRAGCMFSVELSAVTPWPQFVDFPELYVYKDHGTITLNNTAKQQQARRRVPQSQHSLIRAALLAGIRVLMNVDWLGCYGDAPQPSRLGAIVRTSKTNCWPWYSAYEKSDQQIYCLISFPLNGAGPVVLFQSSIVDIYLLYRTSCTIKRSSNFR